MIVVRLSGGLGNQLFQYAFGKAISVSNNKRLLLDLSWFSNIPENITPRKYELNNFNIEAETTIKDRKFLIQRPQNKITRLLWKIKMKIWGVVYYKESGFPYQEFKWKGRTVILDGYWQSYKYFESIREKLLKEIQLKNVSSLYLQQINNIKEKESVGIHIRRGDYARDLKTNQFHGLLSVEYFARALQFFLDREKAYSFFLFTDDAEWVKQNLNLGVDIKVVENFSSHEDLILLSNCSHQIISNSSFSWWAAWLNQNPAKQVIAPLRWFNVDIDTSDLIPEEWKRI